MGAKSVSRKVFCVLAAITVALAASFLWGGEQAHADGKPVARLLNYEHREIRTYENLQDAFGEVKNGQTIQLIRDVETDKEFTINRGMDNEFYLDLNGRTITRTSYDYGYNNKDRYILHIVDSHVVLTDDSWKKEGRIIGNIAARCICLDSGYLDFAFYDNKEPKFSGDRVADVNGGTLSISGGTFENSIIVSNPNAQIIIHNANFEKNANITALNSNACDMQIMGGEFLSKITNTRKTGFITGGKFYRGVNFDTSYIHPEYRFVNDWITRGDREYISYRVEKRPPSIVFTPESGSVEYDPVGSGTEVTAKLVGSDGTTELMPAIYKWYKDGAPLEGSKSVMLNDPGTYKAVGTYDGKSYEAEYVVQPANISSGYTTSIAASATFTGFPYGKGFVNSNAKLVKSGSETQIGDFTFEVKSTGENINAGVDSGTYTIEGTGKYTGKLSGKFNIAKADFSKVNFTLNPVETTYTGVEIRPAVTGTLKTTDNKTYMLDPSEYTVAYGDNIDVGDTASVTVTSANKNFTADTQSPLNFTIKKATNEVNVSIEGWASGETAKAPSVTADADADKATLEYKAKGAADSAYADTVPSTPGDHIVRATVPANKSYEAGVATADFTITPMPLTITGATAEGRAYEKGNTAVAINEVIFKNSKGESVPLTKGTDYTATGVMDDAVAGDGKNVAVSVTLKNGDYTLTTTTTTTTVNIAKAPAPAPQDVRVVGYITDDGNGAKAVAVEESVAGMTPDDAGTPLTYHAGTPQPAGATVVDFSVDEKNGRVIATLSGVVENQNVTLPVTVDSQNYNDATINIVVVPKNKTFRKVTVTGAPIEEKTYGDGTFELTATAINLETGDTIETQSDDWYWCSSNPAVLKVDERGSNTMTVTVNGAGSAMILAWYEPNDGTKIGAAMTEPITVNKRPLTITATDQGSIYVDGTLPDAPTDYTVGPDGGGLVNGDSLSGVTLAYSSTPVNTKPGSYAIVPSGATISRGGTDMSANYSISYVSGTFEVTPKEAQTITAEDKAVIYGETNQAVSATTNGDGAISYAVESGGDCVDVNASTGALTIKKAGTATVTVTATETDTCAQATKDVTVTVGKAETTPATVIASGWTYDTTERRLVYVEGAVSGGIMQYVVGDSADSAPTSGWNSSIPTATEVGTYYVWYKVKGDENHNDTKAQVVIDERGEAGVYVGKADPPSEAPGPLSAICGDLLENVKLPKAENGAWSWAEDPGRMVENAGEWWFYATFTPNDTTNYKTNDSVRVLVNAAKGTGSVKAAPKGKTLTYNGEAQALVQAGTATGGTMKYSLDGEDFTDEIPVGVVAGDYTVWYMVAGDENYNDSEPARVKATIGKASIDNAKVTLEQTSYTYDGKAKEPAVKSVVLNGATLNEGVDYTVSYSNNVNVGTAAAIVTGKGSCLGTRSVPFAIEAAPQNDLQAAGAASAPVVNAASATAADIQAAAASGATTVVLGPKVKKVAAGAFAGTDVTTVIVKTKKLKKSAVKNAFKGSKVKTVKVKIKDLKSTKGLKGKALKKAKKYNKEAKAYNKKIAKKYKKFMTKKVVGKKVKVKA